MKKRIETSLIIMLLLPIAMMVIGIMCLFAYQDRYNENLYGVDANAIESIVNPVRVLDALTDGVYTELKNCSEESPDKLLDEDYLDEEGEKLNAVYAFIAVRKEDEFIYVGKKRYFNKLGDEAFPEYGNGNDDRVTYLSCDNPCLIKQIDFKTGDNKEASAFIIMNFSKMVPQIKSMLVQIIFQFVLVCVCTALVLIMWLYKSMLRPLNGLSRATQRIKEGDLDFTIADETTEEIGTLCEDFESMRIRIKESYEKQIMYEHELREFISNISHDIKTPLTAIKGYTEGLMDGVADTDEKREKYLKTIYTKANAISALVDELSLYSKIDMDMMPYNFIPTSVHEYFNDCVSEMKPDMELRGIKLNYENNVSKDMKMVADPEQIRRVVNNIVENSVKYKDKDEVIINIVVDEKDEDVIVSIEDNGRGIAKEELGRIFERLYRTDASRNSRQGGSGLGLAIAKKIISEHGGDIWADSTEGTGTTITFTLKKYKKDKE